MKYYHYKTKHKKSFLEKGMLVLIAFNVVYFTLFFTGALHNVILPFLGGK